MDGWMGGWVEGWVDGYMCVMWGWRLCFFCEHRLKSGCFELLSFTNIYWKSGSCCLCEKVKVQRANEHLGE